MKSKIKKQFLGLFGAAVLLGGTPIIISANKLGSQFQSNKEEALTITDDNNELKPFSSGELGYMLWTSNDYISHANYYDGAGFQGQNGGLYHQSENNGVFIIQLDSSYDFISIDQYIAINGRYTEYYSEISDTGSSPRNVLVNSTEIFHFQGGVNKGESVQVSSVQVSGDSVTMILDTLNGDNYIDYNVTVNMSLDITGNFLRFTIVNGTTTTNLERCFPGWMIDQIYSVPEGTQEYHEKIGDGIPYMFLYDNQYPEYNTNAVINLTGIKS